MPHPETPGYVKNATGRVLSGIGSRLDALVRKGGDPAKGAAETARYLRPMTLAEQQSLIKEGRAPSHLKTVLRTETTRILSGQKEAIAIRKKKFVRWMIAASHPASDVCDPIATSDHGYGPGVFPAGSNPSPPAHVNCFVGETMIRSTSSIERVYRRWYQGEVVVVSHDLGEFTVTPNHPFLTMRGWIPACEIRTGDNLIGDSAFNDSLGHPYPHHRPVRISEMFRLASIAGTQKRIETRSPDFHGDGMNGDVDIVTINGELLNGLLSEVKEPSSENVLTPSNMRLGELSTKRTLGEVFVGAYASANGVVRMARKLAAFVRRKALHAKAVRFGSSSDLHACEDKPPANSPSLDVVGGGERVFGFSSEVSSDNLIIRKRDAERSIAYRVNHVSRRSFSGHVYNLQTAYGYYTADAIWTGNCRCYLVTVPPEMVSTLSGGRVSPKQAQANAKAWYDKYGPNGPYVPTQEELENLAAIAKQAGLDVQVPGFPKHSRPARLYEIKSRGRGGTFVVNDITGVKVGDLVNYGEGYWLGRAVDGTEFLGSSQFDTVMWMRAKFWSTKQANYKSLTNAAFHTTADLRRASGLPRTTMDYYLRAGVIQPSRRTAAGRLLFDGDEIDLLTDIVKHRDNSLTLRNFRDDFIFRREIQSKIDLPSLPAPKRKHPRIVTESDGIVSEVINKKQKVIGNVDDVPEWIGTKEDKISWTRADYWHGKRTKPATAPNYRLSVSDLDPEGRTLVIHDLNGNVVGDVTKNKDGWSGLVHSKNQLITGDSLDDAASFIVRLDSVGKQNFELGDLIRIPQLRAERLERDRLLGKGLTVKDLQEIPDRPASAPPYRIGKTDLVMDEDNVFPTRINVEIEDLDGTKVADAFWTPETKWTAPIGDTGQLITGRESFNDVAEYAVKKTVQPDMLDANDLDFILALRREAGILDPIPGFTKGAGENYPKYVLKNQEQNLTEVFDSVYDQSIGVLEDLGNGSFHAYLDETEGLYGIIENVPTYDDAFTYMEALRFQKDELNGYDWRFPEFADARKGFNVMNDETGEVIGSVKWNGNSWIADFPEVKTVEFTRLEDAAQALYDRHKTPWDLSDLSGIMDESGTLLQADDELLPLDLLIDDLEDGVDLDELIAVGQPENKLAHDVFGGFRGNQRLGTVFQDGYGRFSYELDDFPGFRKVGFDTIEEATAEAAQMWDNLITAGFSGPDVRVIGNKEVLHIKGVGDFAWIEENVDKIRWNAYSVDIVDGTTYGIHRLDTKDEALDWIWDQQSWMKNTIPRPVLSTPDLNAGLTIERYVDGLGGLKDVKAVVRDTHGNPIAQVQYREYLDQYSIDYIFPSGKSSSYDYFDSVDEAVEAMLNDRAQLDQVTQEWEFTRSIIKRDDIIIDDAVSDNFTLHVNGEFTGYDVFDSTGERAGHAIYSTSKMNPDMTPRLIFYDRHGDEVLDFADATELLDHLEQFNPPEWAGNFNWDDYDDWDKTVNVWKDVELPEPIHVEEHGDVTIFERFGAVRRDPDGGWIGIRVEDNTPQHFLSQSDAINYTVGRDVDARAGIIKGEIGNFNKVGPNEYQWDDASGNPVLVVGLHPADPNALQAIDYVTQSVVDFNQWDEITEYLEKNHLDRFLPSDARGVQLPYGTKGTIEVKQYPALHEISHNGVDVGDISPTWDGRWIARDIYNRQIEVDTYENALHFLTDVASNETAAWRNRRIIAQEHGAQWMSKLDPIEVEAVRNYQTPEYQQINGVLRSVFKNARSRRGVDADAAGIVKAHEFVEKSESFGNDVFVEIAGLDSAMNKSTGIRREGMQAWRATDTGVLHPANNPTPGDVFVDPGFFSTTIADPAETGEVMMENPVNIRVLIPGDAPGGYVPSVTGGEFEREFLLPRNGVFRVVDVDQTAGQVGITTVELVDIAPTTDKRFRNFYEHLIEKAANREGLIPQWKMSKKSYFRGAVQDFGAEATKSKPLDVYDKVTGGIRAVATVGEFFPGTATVSEVVNFGLDVLDDVVKAKWRPSELIKPTMIENPSKIAKSKLKLANSETWEQAHTNITDWGIEVNYKKFPISSRFQHAKNTREAEVLDIFDAVARDHYERGLIDAIPSKMTFKSWQDSAAYYDSWSDEINIDIRHTFWDNDDWAKHGHDTGYMAGGRREDIIVHEFGHRAWYNSPTRTAEMDSTWDDAFGPYQSSRAKLVANEVSAYAAENPAEFISEVYTRSYSSGSTEWASPSVKALYRALGGPPLLNDSPIVNKITKSNPRTNLFAGKEK